MTALHRPFVPFVLGVVVLTSVAGATTAVGSSELVADGAVGAPESVVESAPGHRVAAPARPPASDPVDDPASGSGADPASDPVDDPERVDRAARARTGTRLNVSYLYRRLPSRPGTVAVTMRVPARPGGAIDRVSVAFGDELTVVDATNVTRAGSTYEWTGTRTATITYRLPIDWSYTGTRADAWTLVEHRGPSIDADPAVDIRPHVAVAGEGYVGNRTLLLGAHETYRREAAGQTITVVVPEGVSPLYGPDRTADVLANASRTLRIGAREEAVYAFVTPEIETEAAFLVQPGFALSDTTLLVDADSEVDVWTHEYVHTRQAFSDAERLRWLTEASAEYYGWLLSIRQGYDGWATLRGVLSSASGDDSVLADPDTWGGESDYRKGALVLGALDREIRDATDGAATLQAVLRRVNRARDPTLETLVAAVRDVAGPDVAATAARYVTTNVTPAYDPTRDRLDARYGAAAPRLRTEVLGVAAVGPGWSRPLDPSERPRVGRVETLRVTVRVRNDGRADGIATVAPRVSESGRGTDLTRVDDPWVGRVEAGETVTRTVTHRFDRPGRYDLGAGLPDGVTVVPTRETASVVGVTATHTPDDGPLVVDATVRNDGDRATFLRRPVSLDGQRVATVALVVDGDATRTVTRSVELPTRARQAVDLRVGAARTTVDLSPATSTSTSTSTSTRPPTPTPAAPARPDGPRPRPPIPVLGAVAGLVAVVAALWLARTRE